MKYENERSLDVWQKEAGDESAEESDPEWFSDGIPISNDKENEMWFDESGQYVLAKDLDEEKKRKQEAEDEMKKSTGSQSAQQTSGGFSTPSEFSNSSTSSSTTTSPADPSIVKSAANSQSNTVIDKPPTYASLVANGKCINLTDQNRVVKNNVGFNKFF